MCSSSHSHKEKKAYKPIANAIAHAESVLTLFCDAIHLIRIPTKNEITTKYQIFEIKTTKNKEKSHSSFRII